MTHSPTRPARWARVAVWCGVVAIVIAAIASTKVLPVESTSPDDVLDASQALHDEIEPAIVEMAQPIGTLLTALASDPDAAAEDFGVDSSTGVVYFSTTARGTVSSIDDAGVMTVIVDDAPSDAVVLVQTGPVITGTVLRDATGLIGFNDFVNQVDFLNYSTALNLQLRADLLDPLDRPALVGQRLEIVGAFAFQSSTQVLITPISIESAQ